MNISRNGRSFNIDESSHAQWWRDVYPQWELSTSQFMEQACDANKITLDIGSWNGVHALYMARISKKVFTIEPDPTAFRILKKNLQCNPDIPNIEALALAISDQDGFVKIMDAGGSGSSILQSVQDKYSGIPTVETVCMTFKSFLERYQIPPTEIGFIKMDIEGAEGVCIPDMEWFLKDYTGAVCLSLHKNMASDESLAKVTEIMQKYFREVHSECWVRK